MPIRSLVPPHAQDPDEAGVARLAHDLVNDMALLLWIHEELAERLASQADVVDAQPLLELIDRQARRVIGTLRGSLASTMAGLRPRTDWREVLSEYVALWQRPYAARGQLLALELPSRATVIAAPEPDLRTLIANLLTNAAEHAPDARQVVVRLRTDDRQAVLEVSDDGPGLDADTQRRIFTPRGDRGHGLAQVRAIARRLGGSAWLADQEGPGARFCVSLPLEA